MHSEYYSHGKLLLSGEYFVLKGAAALAIPVKLGQSMIVDSVEVPVIKWQTRVKNKKWFFVDININNWIILKTNDIPRAAFIIKLLKNAFEISENKNLKNSGYKITCNLEFDPEWGLGSSSSLINNIANWLNIDPYELHKMESNGSGYDIACAEINNPIVYQILEGKRTVKAVKFNPSFADEVYFVYSGKKISTEKGIKEFVQKTHPINISEQVTQISYNLLKCKDLNEFERLCNLHNTVIEKSVGFKNNYKKLYKNFKGTIKPLGTWGGDFFMAISNQGNGYVRGYFIKKELPVVFKYKELAL